MEIREIRQDEMELAFYLRTQAFHGGSRDMSGMQHPDRLMETIHGLWDEAGLQCKVNVIDYRVQMGPNVIVPMGGIGGVACLPAARGKGYAATLLRHSLVRMREAGQLTSVLFPFSFDFYAKLGWAWIGCKRTYKLPTRILRPHPETERVRAAIEADRPAIIAAYTEFSKRYRGMIVRAEKSWNQVLNHSDSNFRYTYLYERDGRVEGYLTYMGGKRESTELREFICLTARAQHALLGLLRRHEMQIDSFTWSAPPDDALWSALYHWDIETRLEPSAMGRIVDVPQALTAWKPVTFGAGSVAIGVQDDDAPWNTGTWLVEFADGSVTAKAVSSPPQVSLSIQALSQIYFGLPTAEDLLASDRVAVHDPAGYQALCALLEGPPMWMNDDF